MRAGSLLVPMAVLACFTTGAARLATAQCQYTSSGPTSPTYVASYHNYSNSIAVSGELAAIGSNGSDMHGAMSGSVSLYRYNGVAWGHEARLFASDAAQGDQFGYSVAVSGDWMFVGAPRYEDVSVSWYSDIGAVYVFRRTNGQWQQTQILHASNPFGSDLFGSSVAMNGNFALASTPMDGGGLQRGAVYVYQLVNNTWVNTQKLTGPVAMSSFGTSLSMAGNWAVVGAPHETAGSLSAAGAVYVYEYTGSTWQQRQRLAASDAASQDYFGKGVAVAGSNLVVTAPADDDLGVNSGSAYAFRLNSSNVWQQSQKLVPSNGQAYDEFGTSVAMSLDTVVLGAIGRWTNAGLNVGTAFVYRNSGSTWTQGENLNATTVTSVDYFGAAVAIGANQILVGAPGSDLVAYNAGMAWSFKSSCGSNTPPAVTIVSPSNGASYAAGASVVFSGTANDQQQGNMNAALVWTSSLQGQLGTGASFSRSDLAAGAHTITATATDSGGLVGSASISLTITQPTNTPPTVGIGSPVNGTYWTQGNAITFTGSAYDAQSGNLSNVLSWTSSLQGVIGYGTSFVNSGLVPGWHTITASCTDPGGLTGTASVVINVQPGTTSNTAPTVSISSPTNNSSFTQGTSITFTGSASDQQQGNMSSLLQWKANGVIIGNGASFTRSDLAAGSYVITASVTDSGGLTGTASVNITVTAQTPPPPSGGTWLAASETMVAGKIASGNYTSTHSSNVVYEVLQEKVSGGNPSNRYSYLEHKWLVPVQAGASSATFYVKAYRSSSADNDNFIFEYSTNNSTYIPMLTVTRTVDSATYQSFVLPSNISGTVYVRVRDSDQTPGRKVLDKLYVDHMYIRTQ